MIPIEAVLFDADGVIQLPGGVLEDRFAAALGHPPQDVRAFMNDVFAVEAPTQCGVGDFRETILPVLAKWYPGASVDDFLKLGL